MRDPRVQSRRVDRASVEALPADRPRGIVKDDPTSPIQNELKLTGLVKTRHDGTLAIRNPIYKRVFGESWINEVWPPPNPRVILTVAMSVLLLLSPGFWYEVVYPRQFIRTLEIANGEEVNLAEDAYKRLKHIWFYHSRAENLWGGYNLRRANWAIKLDEASNRRPDAYAAAEMAHAESSRFPAFVERSNERFANFFERRAIREAYVENRDEAILWRLKALTVLPARAEFRRAITQLVGTDYARLRHTIRTGVQPSRRRIIEYRRRPVDLDLAPENGPLEFIPPSPTPPEAPFSTSEFGALSLDGTRLAVGVNRLAAGVNVDTFSVWSVEQHAKEPLILRAPDGGVTAASLSPNGKYFVMAGLKEAYLWRLDQSLTEPAILQTLGELIKKVLFSPDGSRLLTAGDSGTIRVWWTDRPAAEPVILKGRNQVVQLAFSPDSSRLLSVTTATGSEKINRLAQIWRLDQIKAEPTLLTDDLRSIGTIAFSPADGSRIVSALASVKISVTRSEKLCVFGEPTNLQPNRSFSIRNSADQAFLEGTTPFGSHTVQMVRNSLPSASRARTPRRCGNLIGLANRRYSSLCPRDGFVRGRSARTARASSLLTMMAQRTYGAPTNRRRRHSY